MTVIFQGMDAAGIAGAARHVMPGVNPQGCQVFSFQQPSAEELEHDLLWRTTRCLPERGRTGISVGATSTDNAPWYVVPVDDEKNARLIISTIILGVFGQLEMAYPKPSDARRRELKVIREKPEQ